MTFNSRQHAGRLLAKELADRNIKPDLVYGLARGGVAVAAEIAAGFKVGLKPLVVRKISPPGNPEFAIGAIAEGSVWSDEYTLRRLGLTPQWQREQVREKEREIREIRSKRLPIIRSDLAAARSDLSIVLADDGAATGATMMAAIGAIRKRFKTGVSWRSQETPDKNRKVIVALPVASPEAAEKIRQQADETVILSVDPDFRAVGQYYREFNQVSWEEVKSLLKSNNEAYRKTHSRKAPP